MTSPTPAASQPLLLPQGRTLAGIGLICLALICFSLLDAAAKWASPQVGVLQTSFFRYAVSVALVTLVINGWTRPGVTVSAKPWMQWARSLLLFGSTVLNFLALQYLQLAESISIIFLTPLLVALLSGPLLGEWVGRRRMVAIGVGFIGVLIVTRPGTGAMHPAALFSLAGTFCYAFYAILTRILSAHDKPETTMFYSGLAGLFLLAPILPFVWKTPESMLVWGVLLLLGISGTIGHWLLILAHRLAPASTLSPFIYTQLIWMLLLGYLVFGDVPDRYTLVGAAVVTASGLYLLHRERVTGRVPTGTGEPTSR
ncbi:MAG: DMT family transporter [Beijerinckiaceae bacterium]